MAILSTVLRFGRRVTSGGPYPQDNPALVAYDPGNIDSTRAAGVTINSDTILGISAVFRAMQLTGSTIAALPLHVFEPDDEGAAQQVRYERDAWLWRKPNKDATRISFFETGLGHLTGLGNSFMYARPPERDGLPPTVWNVHPDRVEVARGDEGQKFFRLDGDPKKEYTSYSNHKADPRGRIIHVPGFSLDGLVGVNPVNAMADAFGIMKAAEKFAGLFFEQGTTLGGVLEFPGDLNPKEAAAHKRDWDSKHRGLRNAMGVAIASGGVKWVPTSVDPEAAQMLETRQFEVAEVARIFGVPEHLIGSHDKASSWGQGLEVNNRAFLQFTLLPLMIRFEQAINDEILGPDSDSKHVRYMKWNPSGLLRGTNAERASWYREMYMLGVYTTNEIRAFEDLPSIGEEGDVRFYQGNNLQALENALTLIAAGAGKPPAPSEGEAAP